MDMDNLYSCAICMDPYGEKDRPHTLNCGHSFCTKCLNKSVKDGFLVCPHCQQSHRASSAHNFPINYGMEEMISKFKKVHLSEAHSHQSEAMGQKMQSTLNKQMPLAQNLPHKSGTMSSKMQSMVHEHKDSTRNLVHESKEIQSHLHQYKNFLLERRAKHEKLYLQIWNLANHNQEMVKLITNEYEKLTETQNEGESLENIVSANIESLDTITSTKSALRAIDELDKCYVALEEWNRSSREEMPNVKTVTGSEKVMRDTTNALRMVITEEDGAATETLDLSHSSLPIIDKLNRILRKTTLTETTLTEITLITLQNMTESMKTILVKGHMYAVQEREGRLRSAKVTRRDNKTYLHCLQVGAAPIFAHTIEQSDLIETLRRDSVVAFLDLAWEGSFRGRVHILLSPDTPFARHFRILCTGDLGPSYVHSRFLKVLDKGRAKYESVLGGDYEYNDRSGGAPLLRGLSKEEYIYKRFGIEGMVYAVSEQIDGPDSAQFRIGTGTGVGYLVPGIFGQVQDGLNVVKEAIKLYDIRGVTIIDCGVMLPF